MDLTPQDVEMAILRLLYVLYLHPHLSNLYSLKDKDILISALVKQYAVPDDTMAGLQTILIGLDTINMTNLVFMAKDIDELQQILKNKFEELKIGKSLSSLIN